jgi:predicted oxidoreductase (fatty acid repression mutant protein)
VLTKASHTPAQFGSQSSNKIILNIADFDCKYDYITKDFRKTLSADKFPQIHISFGKLKKQQRNLPFCSRSKTHEQGKNLHHRNYKMEKYYLENNK